MLCLYSLKNPSYPEFTCATDTGVMCADWHLPLPLPLTPTPNS